mgnify:FL=1
MECNRRLADLKASLVTFLNQEEEEHVYWVDRGGKTRRNISLNAAPVDVAEFLRERLFGAPTSIILTSATMAVKEARVTDPSRPVVAARGALDYVARRVGGESARQVQVGSPFDYERQMRVHVVSRMPDPRDEGYMDALERWIAHYVRLTHGKAFVLFTSNRLMQEVAGRMEGFFAGLGIECLVQGKGMPRATMLERFKQDVDSVLFGTASFWQGVDVPGEIGRAHV